MSKIRMVDLVSQYEKIREEVDRAILEVVQSTAFINGPEVGHFAEELGRYLNVSEVIPCANGTDALQIAMMGLGLQPGDEVITASFTYVATAEVIALLGLTPVLVDVNPDTFNISPEAIEKAIRPKTKAIVPVHLFGQCADMEAIMAIAKKHNLFVIEDTAQAIGAVYTFADGKKAAAGAMGDVGCTSFFPSKNLGCMGDGGAMYTNQSELASRLKMIANHGQSVRYYHDVIGVNSRLDTIQAAILRIKLRHLDQYIQARQQAARWYDAAFSSLEFLKIPTRAANSTHVFHQYTIQLAEGIDREALRAYLENQGIPTMIYYPVPLHLQKAYRNERYKEGDFPITEQLCRTVLSFPMHTELDEETIHFITNHVKRFFEKQ